MRSRLSQQWRAHPNGQILVQSCCQPPPSLNKSSIKSWSSIVPTPLQHHDYIKERMMHPTQDPTLAQGFYWRSLSAVRSSWSSTCNTPPTSQQSMTATITKTWDRSQCRWEGEERKEKAWKEATELGYNKTAIWTTPLLLILSLAITL